MQFLDVILQKKTLEKLSKLLEIETPSYETVLLGSSFTQQYSLVLSKKENYGLDHILISIKQKLILQRENKIEPTNTWPE